MIRNTARFLLAGAFVFGGMTLISTEASAQATRTWVSGVGDDANPCSRTAPCKTFAGTISKTAAGGEINCIDPGGFGQVSINKSISIICEDVEAGILSSGTNAIVVNAGATDTVIIKGLDIEGFGNGLTGIKIFQVGTVIVEDTTIHDFRGSNGTGITFSPPNANAKLFVTNSRISENGAAAQGGGILITPTATTGTAQVVLSNVQSVDNPNGGVRIDTTGVSGGTWNVMINGGDYSLNGAGLAVVTPAAAGVAVNVEVNGASLSNNNGQGIVTNGGNVTVRVGNSSITGNTSFGVLAASPGASKGILNYNNPASNHLAGNNPDGTFTGTVAQQ